LLLAVHDLVVNLDLVAFARGARLLWIDPRALRLPQALEDLLDFSIVDRCIDRLDADGGVIVDVDGRKDRDGDHEVDRLELVDLHARLAHRSDRFLGQRLTIELVHHLIGRLTKEDVASIGALDHRAGGLALAESWQLDVFGDLAVGLCYRLGELIIVGCDIQHYETRGLPLHVQFHA
jgi:hypothetical protein